MTTLSDPLRGISLVAHGPYMTTSNIANKPSNFGGHKFWARGYLASTVGADEKVVKAFIEENQEKEDKRIGVK